MMKKKYFEPEFEAIGFDFEAMMNNYMANSQSEGPIVVIDDPNDSNYNDPNNIIP